MRYLTLRGRLIAPVETSRPNHPWMFWHLITVTARDAGWVHVSLNEIEQTEGVHYDRINVTTFAVAPAYKIKDYA